MIKHILGRPAMIQATGNHRDRGDLTRDLAGTRNTDHEVLAIPAESAPDAMQAIVELLLAEMQRQREIFGTNRHQPLYWHAILGEEVGEVSRALVEYDLPACRQGLIQVAATALAFALTLDEAAN